MNISRIIHKFALFLRYGRYVARQCMGKNSDWFILALVLLSSLNLFETIFILYALTLGVITLLLSSNLIASEFRNQTHEFIFTSDRGFSGVILSKSIALFLFLAAIAAVIALSIVPGHLLIMKAAALLSPTSTFRHSELEEILLDLPKFWVHVLPPLFFIQTVCLFLGSIFRSGTKTLFAAAICLTICSKFTDNADPFFWAVLPRSFRMPFNWTIIVLQNRLVLMGAAAALMLLTIIRLQNTEKYLLQR